MKRHLLSHRSGIVDQKYIDETNDFSNIVGRRVTINSGGVIKLTNRIENLGRILHKLLTT